MSDFIISCCSTVDMPYSHFEERNIPVLFYKYTIDGEEFVDDMGRDPDALPEFYRQLCEEKKIPRTSQINTASYLDFFEPLLEKGDVIHIAFGSGMTGSVKNAVRAAKMLREKYSERRIEIIDSLCSCAGYGLLVDGAADLRDGGATEEDVLRWIENNKTHIHHQFYSTTLSYFRRSGRMSGPMAAMGTILNIYPIMHLNKSGHIIAYDKVRGRAAALKKTLQEVEAHAVDGDAYSGRCVICHSNCLEEAERLKDALEEKFTYLAVKVEIYDIGTIIAAHCGPGTVAVFFFGDERAE